MITKLMSEAYYRDIELWTENGKLKYRAHADSLTPDFKQQLVEHKQPLIKRISQNRTAKESQWMIFEFGEAYNKRTGERSELFIFRNEDETFAVWRGSWRTGEAKPSYNKTIADRVSFEDALNRANNYMNWSTNKSGSRKAG